MSFTHQQKVITVVQFTTIINTSKASQTISNITIILVVLKASQSLTS